MPDVAAFRCISAIGMLGYGINEEALTAGVARAPHVIGADAGSTDAGPQKLGAGIGDVSRATSFRDIRALLRAQRSAKVPIIIGSAGGSGAAPHVAWTWEILREAARAEEVTPRVAVISADVSRERLKSDLARGRVSALGPVPPLDEATVDRTLSVVGQMGVEPIMRALDLGADVVLAGRSCDAAVFAAPAIRHGVERGLAWHMGELLECGALCASPGSASEPMLATVEDNAFVVEPLDAGRGCTPLSVASHSLYERSHPSRSSAPGFALDVSECRFEALDERRVRVSGSRCVPSEKTFIKLEGAARAGYRTMVVCGVRDPIGIARIDETIEAVTRATKAYFDRYAPLDFDLRFIVYGRDGVMGRLEPTPKITGHEIGLVIDAIASTQEEASTVCAYARAKMQHYYYAGIKATAANLAFPTAPSDTPCGAVYEFTVYHLLQVDDPLELFPIEMRQL